MTPPTAPGTSRAEYFWGDVLGSVRQLTDAQGRITLAKAYNPYGEVTQSAGAGQSSYGYTSEYQDCYNDLVYLRARHYAPAMGRFLSRDTWAGEANHPLSFNKWNYTYSNPVNRIDPTGQSPQCFDLFPWDTFCSTQRFLEIVAYDKLTAGKNALTLVALFEDNELNTKRAHIAGRTASERLEWILKLTRGSDDDFFLDNCVYYGHLPLQFGGSSDFGNDDNYFKDELRDNKFYGTQWTKTTKASNQVGHFLTAVAFGYSMPQFINDWFVIGHELRSDNGSDPNGGLSQQIFTNVTDQMKQNFANAIKADEQLDYLKRDELLWDILDFGVSFDSNYVDPSREGNSLQDLRLTVRGYRFGQWVYNHSSQSPNVAGAWLRYWILK